MTRITLYRKSILIHVRGSLFHKLTIFKERGVEHKYNVINDGEKIKFCFLQKPNPIGENVMAFISQFPKEFDSNDYLDHMTMSTKGFIDPCMASLDAIGYVERTTTLDDFFITVIIIHGVTKPRTSFRHYKRLAQSMSVWSQILTKKSCLRR